MSRLDRRISRPLIAILAIAVCLGASSIFYKFRQPPAAHAQPPSSVPQLAAIAPGHALLAEAPPNKPDLKSEAKPDATTLPDTALADKPLRDAPQKAPESTPNTPGISRLAVPASATESGPASSSSVLSQAKADVEAGKLLQARTQLNELLQTGNLDDAHAAPIKDLIGQINETLVFSRRHVADDPYSATCVVQRGDTLDKIGREYVITSELLSRINNVQPKSLRAGATIKVIEGPFHAVVDKKKFTMDLYLGGLPGEKSSLYVKTYMVGLGRDDSTPVGTWMIDPHKKLKKPTYYSPRGEGVIAADDPKNPLGGYWIGLNGTTGDAVGKVSYGIHGTIEPDSIGKQSSMGCIRLRPEDIAVVFDLLVEGKSLVVVK